MARETLDCFPKLLQDNKNDRINGGLKLIEQLSKEIEENSEESKEISYALNRLVRGLGSSKVSARKGFYTTLTIFLKMNSTVKVEQIFNAIDKELSVSNSSSKGEHSDVYHGRILASGTLIRSHILKSCSIEEQKKVLECLIQNGKQKDYLYFEAISFIEEFLKQLEHSDTITVLWPLLEQETCKPLSEHNLDTFYLLLIVLNIFPNVISKKTIKNCFGSDKIICKDTMKDIAKILTNTPRTVYYKHPVHRLFCQILTAMGKPEVIKQFWEAIDEYFNVQIHKLIKTEKYMAVQLFHLLVESYGKHIENLKNMEPTEKKKNNKNRDKSFLPSLLSTNFLRYLLKRFKNNPIKNDEIAIDFQKALTLFGKVLDQELEFFVQNAVIDKEEETKIRLEILNKLILFPGNVMIEKLTGTKIFQMLMQKLNANGIKELSVLFRDIAANTKFKKKPDSEPEPWKFDERIYAMQIFSVKLMNHSEMVNDYDWRLEQLKFLFNLGLCETNVEQEILPQFKECFYRSLDHKFPKLDDLKNILKSLIAYIDETVFKKEELKLRKPLKEKGQEAWEKMLQLNKKLEKGTKIKEKINAVFLIINLHMGLQLFFEPKMAKEAIDDICSSYEHLKKKPSEENDEPAWVEVVVDLLLLLLSRKSHLLRSLVGCVFPHICPHLTSVAIHSILDTLDPNNNPLISKDDENSKNDFSDEDDKSDDDNNENENDDDEDEEEEENEKDDETTEAESDSDIEESGSEDETTTDLLRMSIQKILYNDAMQTDDEDIDVDNIDEDEGKRLDAQLAAAFKMVKQTRKSNSKKQKEGDQVLMHYRIRVLDLLEIYMESGPSMSLALDMLVPIFQLLEFCIKDPHQKPLENRVRACMKKLAATKKFESVKGVDENILITTLQVMIQESKLTASVSKEMGDKLADCCVFLIRCSQLANITTDSFVKIFEEYLISFFEKRSCIIQPILFKRLLQLCWFGTWKLVPHLVKYAFDENIRSYKRGQALEFLRIFYNNCKMITSEDHSQERFKLETKLCQESIKLFMSSESVKEESEESTSNVGKEIKQKSISNLLLLLFAVHSHQIAEAWDWIEVGKAMACYRTRVSLAKDAKSAYNKLAQRIGAPIVSKNENKSKKVKQHNKKSELESENSFNENHINGQTENHNDIHTEETNSLSKKDKKKKKNKDKLNISHTYDSSVLQNGVHDEPMENGDAVEEVKSEKSKNKRPSLKSSDVPSKKKRKSEQSGD